jgi:hypothetical protein
MNKVISGSIPERVVYIDREPEEWTREYDDGSALASSVVARSSFVADAANPKTRATGMAWAERTTTEYDDYNKEWLTEKQVADSTEQYGPYFDEPSGRWWQWKVTRLKVAKTRKPNVIVTEKENWPMDGYKILSLEHRNEGGRAYKVTYDGRVFDLREDVLLDVLLNSEVKNGVIACSLLWARVGSQMKLIRHNSSLHKDLLATQTLSSKLVTNKLVYGGVYKTKTQTMVYLGRHSYVDYESHKVPEYSGNGWYSNYKYVYTPKEVKPAHIFLTVDEDKLKLSRLGNYKFVYYWNFGAHKTNPKSVYVEKLELPELDELISIAKRRYLSRSEQRGNSYEVVPVAFTFDKTVEEAEALRTSWKAKYGKNAK